jgi:hypothetical protein
MDVSTNISIPTTAENTGFNSEEKLLFLDCSSACINIDLVVEGLRQDKVVLISGVAPENADPIVLDIAEKIGLRQQLEMQAAFASIQGHRERCGKYFMSVNSRDSYQFIPPHSEGNRKANMQLAFFYCFENNTDGGETILFNIDSNSPVWDHVRELVKKVDLCGKQLTPAEIAKAKMAYQINLPQDLLSKNDEILREIDSPITGIRLCDVLVKPEKSYSRILEKDLNVYWDNIASIDFSSGAEYFRLLRTLGLLKMDSSGMDISRLDNAYHRRLWNSGVMFENIFKAKIVRKLVTGNLVVMNNLSWSHSTNNWTPNSGNRKVVAAFA